MRNRSGRDPRVVDRDRLGPAPGADAPPGFADLVRAGRHDVVSERTAKTGQSVLRSRPTERTLIELGDGHERNRGGATLNGLTILLRKIVIPHQIRDDVRVEDDRLHELVFTARGSKKRLKLLVTLPRVRAGAQDLLEPPDRLHALFCCEFPDRFVLPEFPVIDEALVRGNRLGIRCDGGKLCRGPLRPVLQAVVPAEDFLEHVAGDASADGPRSGQRLCDHPADPSRRALADSAVARSFF